MKKYRLYILAIGVFMTYGARCTANSTGAISYLPTNVDMQRIRTTRISRHNMERTGYRLPNYTGSAILDMTAQKRAEYLASINKATHERPGSGNQGYYNYKSIKSRFTGMKIDFPQDKTGIPNFTENLARNTYKCKKADCTDDLINALKKGFAFFMSEKKYRGSHYKAIINKQFTIMGMGIGVTGSRYYVVTHYATQIIK